MLFAFWDAAFSACDNVTGGEHEALLVAVICTTCIKLSHIEANVLSKLNWVQQLSDLLPWQSEQARALCSSAGSVAWLALKTWLAAPDSATGRISRLSESIINALHTKLDAIDAARAVSSTVDTLALSGAEASVTVCHRTKDSHGILYALGGQQGLAASCSASSLESGRPDALLSTQRVEDCCCCT